MTVTRRVLLVGMSGEAAIRLNYGQDWTALGERLKAELVGTGIDDVLLVDGLEGALVVGGYEIDMEEEAEAVIAAASAAAEEG